MATTFADRFQRLLGRLGSRRQGLSSKQRRLHVRPECRTVVTCRHEGATFTAVVEDISMTGLRLVTPRELPPGSRVSLARDDGHGKSEVRVEIVWCRSCPGSPRIEVGARFASYHAAVAHSWLEPVLACHSDSACSLENRGYYRAPARLPAEVTADDRGQRVTLRGQALDISRTGMQFESRHIFAVGDEVDVTLACRNSTPLRIRGRVTRCRLESRGSQVGIEFHEVQPLVGEQLDWLVHRLLQSHFRHVA